MGEGFSPPAGARVAFPPMTGGLKAAPEGLLAVVAVLGEITFLQRLRGPLSGAAPLFYAGLTVSSSMGASMRRGPQKVMWIAGGAGRAARAIERQIDRERFVVITTDTELDVTDREAVQQYASINRPDRKSTRLNSSHI